MAGELGLEPRMTVPKPVVLPLHHSPAGPARPGPKRREAVEYAKLFSDATPSFRTIFLGDEEGLKRVLAGYRCPRYKPRPHFGARPYGLAPSVGVWLSLVEHCVRDAGVGGSNPLTPTILSSDILVR